MHVIMRGNKAKIKNQENKNVGAGSFVLIINIIIPVSLGLSPVLKGGRALNVMEIKSGTDV